MLKGNCRKKNLTTCERKISSYKPAFRNVTKLTGKNTFARVPFLIKLQAEATQVSSYEFGTFLRKPFL